MTKKQKVVFAVVAAVIVLGMIMSYIFSIKMVDYLKKALIYGHTSRISS